MTFLSPYFFIYLILFIYLFAYRTLKHNIRLYVIYFMVIEIYEVQVRKLRGPGIDHGSQIPFSTLRTI